MAFPKDLRQRMINLMYLVLMALLALQIDPSALLAFQLVEKGLDNAGQAFTTQNSSIMSAIKEKADEAGDGSAASDLYSRAQQLQSLSSNAQQYLDQLISEVTTTATTEGEFNLNSKEASDLIMIEQPGSKGRAPELRKKIDSVKAQFINLINATDQLDEQEKQQLVNSIPLSTEIPEGLPNPDNYDWEEFTFKGKPAISLLTILKQIRNDVKTTEGAIIGKYAQKLDIDQLKFDQFRPAVIPSSTYLQEGDTFTADIFLAASSKQGANNYTVTVNGRTIPVDENGIARYTAKQGVGEYSINGAITTKNPETGETETYQFENPVTYQVAAPSGTVSADKMNVLYIGLDNPISVSAAGVPLGEVTASCSGCQLSKQGPGQYIARTTEQGDVSITVSANGRTMTTKEFRSMRVPDPTPRLGVKKSGSTFSTGEIAAQSFVQANLENFVFDAKFDVVGFEIWYLTANGNKRITGSGARLTSEMQNYLGRLRPGAQVVIKDVKVKGPDGTTRNIGSAIYGVR